MAMLTMPMIVSAVNITVPSAPGLGYMLISTPTGAYTPVTTNPAVFGSITTNSGATSTFAGGINILTGCFAVNGTCFTGGGSGTPASPAKSVQFNNYGAFGGDANFSFSTSTQTLTIENILGVLDEDLHITTPNTNNEGDIYIVAGNAVSGDNFGNAVEIVGGIGSGNANGGTNSWLGGKGGDTGGGGYALMAGGDSGDSGGIGGDADLFGGNTVGGSGGGGIVHIDSGDGNGGGAPGQILLKNGRNTTSFSTSLDTSLLSATRLQKFQDQDGVFAMLNLSGDTLQPVLASTFTLKNTGGDNLISLFESGPITFASNSNLFTFASLSLPDNPSATIDISGLTDTRTYLAPNANGTICLDTTCASGFSTTSADYWKSVNNFFSTTSANVWASFGLAFSTTSSDFWRTTKWEVNYPFPNSATSSPLMLLASTTIGNGAQAGGLTISGGATTTGFLTVQGLATSTFANGINITAGCFSSQGTCLQTFIQNATAYKAASSYATAGVLAGTPTYNNGASGVGATLTEVGFGALAVDGASPTLGQRILVKNQADQTQNGVYTVTTVGSGIASYVLTRATDFNTANDVYAGVTVPVLAGGTVNGDTSWVETTTGTITIGSSNIVFIESSIGTSAVTSVTGTYPIISSGGFTPIISTAFGTTTPWGIGNNGFVVTGATGAPFTSASSSLNLPNTALQNSSITINNVAIALGSSGTITAASSSLLGDINNWSGGNIFQGSTTFNTNATTTGTFFATNASSTKTFGANLSQCNGANQALNWNAGLFGCVTIAGSGGVVDKFSTTSSTRDSNAIFVNASNNTLVGIGTTTPHWMLTIASSTGPQIQLNDTTQVSPGFFMRAISNTLYIGTTSPTNYSTTTTPIMAITQSGKVSIGIGTPAVVNATLQLYEQNGMGASPSMIFGGNSAGDTDYWLARITNNDGGDNDSFQIGRDTTPGTTPFVTINNGGSVGIGTTSPFRTLTLASSTGAQLMFTDAGVTNNPWNFWTKNGKLFLSTSSPTTGATSTVTALYFDQNNKIGFGCENTGPTRFTFGCGSNANVNPNIMLLAQSPDNDARIGASGNSHGTFITSGDASTYGGVFAHDYTGGVPINLALNQFGGNVGVGSTSPGTLFGIGNAGNFVNLSNTSTSTFSNGINILTGCFAINGTCLNTNGSGTPGGSGTNLQYKNGSNFAGVANSAFSTSGSWLSFGTTTSALGVVASGSSTEPQFVLSDNTGGDNEWVMWNKFGNLMIATSTGAQNATSSVSAITVDASGTLYAGTRIQVPLGAKMQFGDSTAYLQIGASNVNYFTLQANNGTGASINDTGVGMKFHTAPAGLVDFVWTVGGNAIATWVIDQLGHFNNPDSGETAPSVGTCGTSPAMQGNSNDNVGIVLIGKGATASCTITFGQDWSTSNASGNSQPVCVVTLQTTTIGTTTIVTASSTPTSLIIRALPANMGGSRVSYICQGFY